LLFLVVAFFIMFPGKPAAAHKEQAATVLSPDNPFSKAKPVQFPFEKDHLAYGDELLHNSRLDDAMNVYANIYASDPSDTNKAAALIAGCDAATRKGDDNSERFAHELCFLYLQRFPQGAEAATAHFYLGYLMAGEHDVTGALAHFSTITADFPSSGHAS